MTPKRKLKSGRNDKNHRPQEVPRRRRASNPKAIKPHCLGRSGQQIPQQGELHLPLAAFIRLACPQGLVVIH